MSINYGRGEDSHTIDVESTKESKIVPIALIILLCLMSFFIGMYINDNKIENLQIENTELKYTLDSIKVKTDTVYKDTLIIEKKTTTKCSY